MYNSYRKVDWLHLEIPLECSEATRPGMAAAPCGLFELPSNVVLVLMNKVVGVSNTGQLLRLATVGCPQQQHSGSSSKPIIFVSV